MDILVTFEDGTTELRAANSPSLAEYDPTNWHPSDFTMADVVPARPEPVVAFLRPGERRGTHALQAWREGGAMVWRITGGWGKGEPLTGEWRLCRVEAWWHQIERLTREQDAEKARADVGEKRLRAFVREIATGYDHDEDAHRHRNGACRVCNAEKLAAELGFEIEEDAR